MTLKIFEYFRIFNILSFDSPGWYYAGDMLRLTNSSDHGRVETDNALRAMQLPKSRPLNLLSLID